MSSKASKASSPSVITPCHSYEHNQSPTSPILPSASLRTLAAGNLPHASIFAAKPFDSFRPLGGGAQRDIFRRFKILASEEEEFLLYWARQSLKSGIFCRDEDGVLVFRISPADLSGLKACGIGRSDMQAHCNAQWLMVYDEEGVSWLTRFRCIDLENFPTIYDTSGQPIRANGRLGRYGPSGMTPGDYHAQLQLESALAGIRATL
ncbi:hypothetical protein BS50DRAFT_582033 [Corynespora cassiicola Philippines]|uniref:Uncharacterized protein n=1 Tax=Corynespora cassiicola Philippines TaxID=1448308 RepID=A0A2T2PCD9_CORCC|nr:hypothetical protein BS50DRAFT_582033 [Corynespora cassiicola Philippines]